MVKMLKPVVVDEQIKLNKHKYIMSRTDVKGNIEFGNDYFFEISGYTEDELMAKRFIDIRRHKIFDGTRGGCGAG